MIKQTVFRVFIAVFCTSLAQIASGDIILNTIGNIQWDRFGSPTASPDITFSVSTDSSIVNGNALNSFGVALRAVARAGATGSISLNSAVVPGSNPVFPAFFSNQLVLSQAGGVPVVNGTNLDFSDVTISTSRNLFTLKFNSPMNDAEGIFEIYAVPEFSNYFPSTEFDGFKFANVPDGPDVLLGTINVTAVPEPSSLIISIFIASSGIAARKRSKLRSANRK